jgi:hypothetical protein
MEGHKARKAVNERKKNIMQEKTKTQKVMRKE